MLNKETHIYPSRRAIIRFTEADSLYLNKRSPLLDESTFLTLSLPIIVCLAIADRAKLNCRRRDIGFERTVDWLSLTFRTSYEM